MSDRPTRAEYETAIASIRRGPWEPEVSVVEQEMRALQAMLERPENERVKQLKIAQASIDSLEREVRALRSANATLVDEASIVDEELEAARATVARVEALPAFWRTLDVSSCEKLEDEGRWRLDRCADDLEAALTPRISNNIENAP